MDRVIVGLFGLVMALFPGRVRTMYERLAIENLDECTAKPSSVPATRVEGLVFAVSSSIGGKAYAWVMYLLGLAGVLAVLFPNRSLAFSTRLTYEEPAAVEWNGGFITLVRGFGAFYLLLAFRAYTRRNTTT